jgi:hypothetical protein
LTSLTIDDDIAAKLNAEMPRSGRSFKEIVNEFLRLGLNMLKDLKTAEPFKVHPRKLGVPSDQIEGPKRH